MLLDPAPPFVKLGAEAILAERVPHETVLLHDVGVLGKPLCVEALRNVPRFKVSHLIFMEDAPAHATEAVQMASRTANASASDFTYM